MSAKTLAFSKESPNYISLHQNKMHYWIKTAPLEIYFHQPSKNCILPNEQRFKILKQNITTGNPTWLARVQLVCVTFKQPATAITFLFSIVYLL